MFGVLLPEAETTANKRREKQGYAQLKKLILDKHRKTLRASYTDPIIRHDDPDARNYECLIAVCPDLLDSGLAAAIKLSKGEITSEEIVLPRITPPASNGAPRDGHPEPSMWVISPAIFFAQQNEYCWANAPQILARYQSLSYS